MPWGFAIGAVGAVASSAIGAGAAGDATDAASRSASETAQLGRDQLDFTKQQYNDSKAARDAAVATAQQTAEQQLASMKAQDAIAADYNNYNKTTFRPLEQGIVADAQNYDTPAKREAAATGAMADVNSSFANSNAANARALAANGINPGSARAISAMGGQGIEQAKANAGAAYKARQGVETMGHAMEMDAASLGRNLPSNQTATAQTALNAGNSAVNSANAGLNATNSGVQTVQNGYQGAVNASSAAGSLFNSAQSIAQQGNAGSAAAWGSLGSSLGKAFSGYSGGGSSSPSNKQLEDMYGFSDENLKTDIAPIDDDAALEAVNATPVKKWRYDPAKMAAQGLPMGDEQQGEQIGPMAQDVNRTMGEEAAPEGKRISLVTLNGVNMRATQAVDKKVDRLTKQVSSLAHMIGAGQLEARAA
jgi:hypothetical protein